MTIGSQLLVQAIGIVIVGLFTFVVTFGLLKLVSVLTGGIRVSAEEEQIGLDIVDHDEKGYSM
jgi:Amt family ammonium transporter